MVYTFSQVSTYIDIDPALFSYNILQRLEIAYNGSAGVREMFDNWISNPSNSRIKIYYNPGHFDSFPNQAIVNIDPQAIQNLTYISKNGLGVQYDLTAAILHEFGHALTGAHDNVTANDFTGNNLRLMNPIFKVLGFAEIASYIGQDIDGTAAKAGFSYTGGQQIDNAVVDKGIISPDPFNPGFSLDTGNIDFSSHSSRVCGDSS